MMGNRRIGNRERRKEEQPGVAGRLAGRRTRGSSLTLIVLLLAGLFFGTAGAQSDYGDEILAELMALQQEEGLWTQPGRTFASTRYSPLDQIDSENVSGLQVAWTFSTGVLQGHEGQPLMLDGHLYFVTPFPNIVYAIDLEQPGQTKWQFEPPTDPRAVGSACCDVVNLGLSYADGKLFFNTLAGTVYALDIDDGSVVWQAKNADPHLGQTMTNVPLVAKDKVVVGVSGGEFGVRGYITAYDLRTGERVWRWYNTGPDEDVGIGERFDPFYEHLRGEDLGVNTWPGDQWKLGGATVWAWFSYDPELNLIYSGTSNPGTWNPSLRRGNPDGLEDQVAWANLWAASVMARDLDTGELVWAYQFTPHDEWDYDGVNENVLLDLEIAGEERKVLVHFERNGFAYVIDRATGEVISAERYGDGTNWAERIDLETGLPVRNPEKGTAQGVLTENICPAAMGYKDRQPGAYSPETGLHYVPTNNVCMDYQATDVSYTPGVPYVGATVRMYAGPGGNLGALIAWDPVRAEKAWEIPEDFAVWSGTMATGGNLAFYGTLDGELKAVDAESGELLWSFNTGSGIVGGPITYLGPDGRQYVAVLSGVGGWAGAVVAGGINPDDPTAALGAVGAFGDLGRYTKKGGALFVFALPDSAGE